ncbi:sensor histidine kinase [Flavobacterium branchiicola]|uniref:histidine kinase n=1 Tax=Flavobacterium branchiicola TaxID=1114875 RepID=A0ABV9PD24_9FLAO|nr:PAS domain-containing sensor histidine kinase [Flavobacterium branchiicola]MBS7253613.1 PAS domain-containing sensor histidine kinase [Flavobacterium branchiicola]
MLNTNTIQDKTQTHSLAGKVISKIQNSVALLLEKMFSKKENKNSDAFLDLEYDSNCSLSFWLMDSYMEDLIEKPLLTQLSDDNSQVTLEKCGMGVWHWDLTTDIVFYSAESFKILGTDSDDVFDNWGKWCKIIHPEDLENFCSYTKNIIDDQNTEHEHCYRVLTNSGKYKWIIDKAKVVKRNSVGKPLKVAGVHTDISFRGEKEIKLEETIRHISKQNKQLVNFTHIVSHNLRSHTGNLKLLLDVNDLIGEGNYDETFANLKIVFNDLNETIAHLSDVASVQDKANIVIEPVDVALFLNKVITVISPLIDEKKVVVINHVPEGSVINFNPAYLESILLNLSTNALKYASSERVPMVRYHFYEENHKKILTVTDNGLGIDLEKYGEVLFDIFRTFHSAGRGSGLGLHMVKSQLDAMQAKLEVTSEVNVGTCFKIIFKD